MNLSIKSLRFLRVLMVFLTPCLASVSIANQEEDQHYLDRWFSEAKPLDVYTGKPIQLKFAHPAPPASILPPLFQKTFDWIERRSGGNLMIKQYGSGTLYGVKGGFKAIRAGVADFGMCYSLNEKKGFELTRTLHVPLVTPDNPMLKVRVMAELAPRYMAPEFERRGVHLGFMAPLRPLGLMSKEPIRQPKDLKGKKVISFMNTPGFADAIGFVEVQLPFPEVYTALQQGMADAVIWVDSGFIPYKIYEQAKYYTAIKGASPTLDSCINRKSYSSLPEHYKKTFYETQQLMSLMLVQQGEMFAQQADALYQANGVHKVTLAEEDKAAWQKAYQPMLEQWLDACDKTKKDCRGLVKEFQRLAKQYQGYSSQQLMSLMLNEPVPGIFGSK